MTTIWMRYNPKTRKRIETEVTIVGWGQSGDKVVAIVLTVDGHYRVVDPEELVVR